MCNNIPNKRRRQLEALIIQKHHSERKQGDIISFKINWFCAYMIFPMPFLSMAAVEIHSIEIICQCDHHQCEVVECIVYSKTSAKAQDILFEDKTFQPKMFFVFLAFYGWCEIYDMGSCLLWTLSWGGLTDISYFQGHVHICGQVCLASRFKTECPAIAWSSFLLAVRLKILALCLPRKLCVCAENPPICFPGAYCEKSFKAAHTGLPYPALSLLKT